MSRFYRPAFPLERHTVTFESYSKGRIGVWMDVKLSPFVTPEESNDNQSGTIPGLIDTGADSIYVPANLAAEIGIDKTYIESPTVLGDGTSIPTFASLAYISFPSADGNNWIEKRTSVKVLEEASFNYIIIGLSAFCLFGLNFHLFGLAASWGFGKGGMSWAESSCQPLLVGMIVQSREQRDIASEQYSSLLSPPSDD